MRLLVITQTYDETDPVLGFFTKWVAALAARVKSIEVIALGIGHYTPLPNVRVYSLGKEKGKQFSFMYALSFILRAWGLRHEYDAVFVHMNQEYVLLFGWLWKLLGKRLYLWRNHYAGSWLTDIAAGFCDKVFCTSKHSYTAKYKKTVIMPVGVDTSRFHPDPSIERMPRSILFLARMTPSKRPEMLLEALEILHKKNVDYTAYFIGGPVYEGQHGFYTEFKNRANELQRLGKVDFGPGIPNDKTPRMYASHLIFVNCSPSGMFDKTIFEAAASGATVLASSEDFAREAGKEYFFKDAAELAEKLEYWLEHKAEEKQKAFAQSHALPFLVEKLVASMSS